MLSILEGGKVPARGHQHWPGSAGCLFVGGQRLHKASLGRTRKMEADRKWEGTPGKGREVGVFRLCPRESEGPHWCSERRSKGKQQ